MQLSRKADGTTKSILVEAYTDPVRSGDGKQTVFKHWELYKPSIYENSMVTAMYFDEDTRYLSIDLENGFTIKKYNPYTLIYKPNANTNEDNI